MGTVTHVPGPCGSKLLDLKNSLEVQLAHQDGWLQSCDDDALVAGTNLAIVGEELLQFGSAVALGQGRFRLSRLLRGRGGSEWATGSHGAGERFVLLDAAALARVDLPPAAMNTVVSAMPLGLVDGEEMAAERVVSGESLRPPTPAHLSLERSPDGNLRASWVRRSRLGWNWNDETDVPLAEASERYRVRVTGPAGAIERMTSKAEYQSTAAELHSLGQGSVAVAVTQIGDFGASREVVAHLNI